MILFPVLLWFTINFASALSLYLLMFSLLHVCLFGFVVGLEFGCLLIFGLLLCFLVRLNFVLLRWALFVIFFDWILLDSVALGVCFCLFAISLDLVFLVLLWCVCFIVFWICVMRFLLSFVVTCLFVYLFCLINS